MAGPAVVWFRNDLRLADNPALTAAVESGGPVILLYILEESPGIRRLGGAERWWLHHSLESLGREAARLGGRLTLRRGDPREILPGRVHEAGAGAVFWNRRYDAGGLKVDAAVSDALGRMDVEVGAFDGTVLHAPSAIRTSQGSEYRVFTPFWRAIRARPVERPLPTPAHLPTAGALASDRLEHWGLLPVRPDWSAGLQETWTPGEAAAQERLERFLSEGIDGYAAGRDRPGEERTSRLSPHLRWGEISPRQIWHWTLDEFARDGRAVSASAERFLSELGWRELSYHLLAANRELPDRPLRPEFERFPWQPDPVLLRAWQGGRTGYPIVDAGMRQLWRTGWMHNRVRMAVASFLTKQLLQPWQDGAAWFLDTLVDADLASNSQNWQWVAGCGADAAPYFRIFNPVLQGRKFDSAGDYVRNWIPELRTRPAARLHEPLTPEEARHFDYPRPIVDLTAARARALAAFPTLSSP